MFCVLEWKCIITEMPKRSPLLLSPIYNHEIICVECNRQFNSRKLFELHSKVAHNEVAKVVDGPLLECDICCAGFPDMKALLKHAKKHFK